MTKEKIKILTNVRYAQTAGIAQVVFSLLDFLEKSKNQGLEIVAVDVINSKKYKQKVKKRKKATLISIYTPVPDIKKIVEKAENLADVEEKYKKIIALYQEIIKSEKPDVVLINGTFFISWCLLIAAIREGVKTMVHYHGILTKEVFHYPSKARKIFYEMERCFDRSEIFYIFPSLFSKKVVEKEVFGHKIKNFKIIANPVPDYFFAFSQNTNNSLKVSKGNIAIISRWSVVKNIEFVKKILKYNYKMGKKFVINIITDLSPKKKEYKELCKLAKVYKPVPNKKLPSFYQKMNLVLSPSYFETYGNVAQEAIASGVPALISSSMGVSDTFRKLGLKFLIKEFRSVKEIYKEIEKIVNKGIRIEKDIQKKLKDNYNWSLFFKEMVGVVRDFS